MAKVYDTPGSTDERLAAVDKQVWSCERAPGDPCVRHIRVSICHPVLETVALHNSDWRTCLLTGTC